MNRHEVLLNMLSDKLVLRSDVCQKLECEIKTDKFKFTILKKSTDETIVSSPVKYTILKRANSDVQSSHRRFKQKKRFKITKINKLVNISMIEAVSFNMLAIKRHREKET